MIVKVGFNQANFCLTDPITRSLSSVITIFESQNVHPFDQPSPLAGLPATQTAVFGDQQPPNIALGAAGDLHRLGDRNPLFVGRSHGNHASNVPLPFLLSIFRPYILRTRISVHYY